MNDLSANPEVTSLLIKAQHEDSSDSPLDHKSIFHVFNSVVAYLIIAEQISDFVE